MPLLKQIKTDSQLELISKIKPLHAKFIINSFDKLNLDKNAIQRDWIVAGI
jgi:hypothetical protein